MRAILGMLSLLVVVAVIGVLAQKQLSPAAAPPRPAAEGLSLPGSAAGPMPAQHSQQIPQQYRQALEGAMQQPRPVPDDK